MYTIALFSVIIGLVLVGILAGKANRSVVGWIFFSFIITPFIASLILYLINPNEDFKRKKGLAYLIVLIVVAGLFCGSIIFPDILSGLTESSSYEVAESSKTGDVCILSFSKQSLHYSVQVQNNTNKNIRSVTFRVVYYDKEGNQIDYSDETSNCSIDAHMTKTLEIYKFKSEPSELGKATIILTNYSHQSTYRY